MQIRCPKHARLVVLGLAARALGGRLEYRFPVGVFFVVEQPDGVDA